jgi:hypothetical protein
MTRLPGDPSAVPPSPERALDGSRFAATVQRLRSEVDHLRRALQHRAVIEQAKGMLAERNGCTPDQAFAELTALSQRYNVKLVQLAATVVAAATPGPAAPTPRADVSAPPAEATEVAEAALDPDTAGEILAELDPTVPLPRPVDHAPHDRPAPADTAEDRARFELLRSRLLATSSPDEVLEAVVADVAWPAAPRTAYLFALEPDGALRLLGGHGVSARGLSEWRRIPPGLDLPFTVTSRYGVPLWVENDQAALRRFPQLAALPGGVAPSFCTLPLSTGGFGIGVLGLSWDHAEQITDTHRGYLLGVADLVAGRIAELTRDDPAASTQAPRGRAGDVHPAASEVASPLLVQLDTMFNPAALLTPIRVGGEVVDFRFDYCNAATVDIAGRPGGALIGRTLLELYPSFATNGYFDAYRATLLDGNTAQFDAVPLSAGVDEGRADVRYDIRVARLWDGLLLTWRPAPAPVLALLDLMTRAENATGSGSFSYDVSAGELIGSPGMFRLVGHAGGPGALRVSDLLPLIVAADRPAARDAAALALGGQSVTVTLGLATVPAGRWVSLTAQPVRDATGRLLRIDGAVRAGVGRRDAGPRPQAPGDTRTVGG